MSTLKVNTLEEATSGGATYFTAKAWVNFNGTGTVSINDDGAVSSISDNGTGRYTSNFSNSLSSANYATSFDNTSYNTNNASVNSVLEGSSNGTVVSVKTTSQVRGTNASNGTNYDSVSISHIIIG